MILSNAHTHSAYCDGKNTLREMILGARALGFTSLGFSGHAHQPFDPEYCMSESNQAMYLTELRALQKEATGLRIWAGIERDALADADRAPFDYVIGSTHYLPEFFEGQPVAVDGSMALLERALMERYKGDGLALARDYYTLESDYIAAYRPEIIGHFDLVRKYNGRLPLFDMDSKEYLAVALGALEKAYQGCTLLEVNTGGMARDSSLLEPFPARALLSAWRELGGRVIVCSDAHRAQYLDYRFDETAGELRKLGYEAVTVLGDGDTLLRQQAI